MIFAWQQMPWLTAGFGTIDSEGWEQAYPCARVNQFHSAIVMNAGGPGSCGDGDALVTSAAGLLLTVRTADCVPVLLADPKHRVVAAIHAGWRGTAVAIIAATIRYMALHHGTRPADILAAVGPAIGACCYEVGPEVAEQFGYIGRVKLDLAGENRRQLIRAGVGATQIAALNLCTRCDAARFHSFRRDGERAGRLVSGIMVSGIAISQ